MVRSVFPSDFMHSLYHNISSISLDSSAIIAIYTSFSTSFSNPFTNYFTNSTTFTSLYYPSSSSSTNRFPEDTCPSSFNPYDTFNTSTGVLSLLNCLSLKSCMFSSIFSSSSTSEDNCSSGCFLYKSRSVFFNLSFSSRRVLMLIYRHSWL